MKTRILAALAIAFVALSPVAAFAVGNAADSTLPTEAVDWSPILRDYILTPAAGLWLVSLLTAILPHGEPGTFWGLVRSLLDLLANNWGNAKNAPKV